MKVFRLTLLVMAWLGLLSGCGGHRDETAAPGRTVETSGKKVTALDMVPGDVLAAARAARPDLSVTEAEHEVRDGRDYYDVGGLLPDGSEMELDMTQVDGVWTVVEFQRDVGTEALPEAVAEALGTARPDWLPERIIESEQADGIVIYEFFGTTADAQPLKVEVKWDGTAAEVLQDEWLH